MKAISVVVFMLFASGHAQSIDGQLRRISQDTLKKIYRASLNAGYEPIVDVTRFDGWDDSTEYTAITMRRNFRKNKNGTEEVSSAFVVVRMKCDQKCWNVLVKRAQKETDTRLVEVPPSARKDFALQEVTIAKAEAVKLYSDFGKAAGEETKQLFMDNVEALESGPTSIALHAPFTTSNPASRPTQFRSRFRLARSPPFHL